MRLGRWRLVVPGRMAAMVAVWLSEGRGKAKLRALSLASPRRVDVRVGRWDWSLISRSRVRWGPVCCGCGCCTRSTGGRRAEAPARRRRDPGWRGQRGSGPAIATCPCVGGTSTVAATDCGPSRGRVGSQVPRAVSGASVVQAFRAFIQHAYMNFPELDVTARRIRPASCARPRPRAPPLRPGPVA